MESATKNGFYSKQTHTEMIYEHSNENCADYFHGEPFNCALEVLK